MSLDKIPRPGQTPATQRREGEEPTGRATPLALPTGYLAYHGVARANAGAAVQRAARPGALALPAGYRAYHEIDRAAGAVAVAAEDTAYDAVHEAARLGTSGAAGALPHLAEIQRSFGRHDVSGVKAHLGPEAEEGALAMGAEAFAVGDHAAFAGAPSLRVAAHEAAHVVQQRAGVHLSGGVGAAGDPHEQHADAVADLVVAGRSAEPLLAAYAGPATGSAGAAGGVQRLINTQGGTNFKSLATVKTQARRRYNVAISARQGDALEDMLEDDTPRTLEEALRAAGVLAHRKAGARPHAGQQSGGRRPPPKPKAAAERAPQHQAPESKTPPRQGRKRAQSDAKEPAAKRPKLADTFTAMKLDEELDLGSFPAQEDEASIEIDDSSAEESSSDESEVFWGDARRAEAALFGETPEEELEQVDWRRELKATRSASPERSEAPFDRKRYQAAMRKYHGNQRWADRNKGHRERQLEFSQATMNIDHYPVAPGLADPTKAVKSTAEMEELTKATKNDLRMREIGYLLSTTTVDVLVIQEITDYKQFERDFLKAPMVMAVTRTGDEHDEVNVVGIDQLATQAGPTHLISDQYELRPQPQWQAGPWKEKNAILINKATMGGGGKLYRYNTTSGKGRLEQVSADDELSFGETEDEKARRKEKERAKEGRKATKKAPKKQPAQRGRGRKADDAAAELTPAPKLQRGERRYFPRDPIITPLKYLPETHAARGVDLINVHTTPSGIGPGATLNAQNSDILRAMDATKARKDGPDSPFGLGDFYMQKSNQRLYNQLVRQGEEQGQVTTAGKPVANHDKATPPSRFTTNNPNAHPDGWQLHHHEAMKGGDYQYDAEQEEVTATGKRGGTEKKGQTADMLVYFTDLWAPHNHLPNTLPPMFPAALAVDDVNERRMARYRAEGLSTLISHEPGEETYRDLDASGDTSDEEMTFALTQEHMSANRKPIPDHTTRLYQGTFRNEIGDRDAPRQSARLARLPPRPEGALLDTAQEDESSMEEDESNGGG